MKLSNFLGILTILEALYITGLELSWWTSQFFTIQHEDYILIAHIMTWFIVRSIETIKILHVKDVNIDKVEMR